MTRTTMVGIPGVGALRGWIGRQAFRRGLLGSSRAWLIVYVLGRVVRLVRYAAGPKQAQVVFSERLAPGNTIRIRHRQRKRG